MMMSTRLSRAYRILTGWARLLPDFIIIGAQRCGTTSLYNYLVRHPNVMSAFSKEVHFFDRYFRRGIVWYRSFFPLWVSRWYVERTSRRRVLVGESTPYYLFHPQAPRRAYGVVPQAKLIVLLRNPVDRAYSHYNHEVKIGAETLPFENALEREQEVLPLEMLKLLDDEDYYSFYHQHHSYLSRGIYLPQLQAWTRVFPRDQMLILNSESLYRSPSVVMERAHRFLGLPHQAVSEYERYNRIHYQSMNAITRARLVDYFRPYNQALYEYLGTDFGWDE